MRVSARYSMAQIALHWIIAVLFVFNYIVSDGMGKANFQRGSGQAVEGAVASWHVPVGVILLVLMVLRLILRLTQGAPTEPAGGNPLLTKAASALHGLFYLLLLLGPIAGMAAWFGGVGALGDAHSVMMNVAFYLVLVHIAAALYHQFILKDNLIARMRPM